jgi:hypothetical protein
LLYNWLANKTTVKERFAFMFNNEILADVHFKVILWDSVQLFSIIGNHSVVGVIMFNNEILVDVHFKVIIKTTVN